MYGFAKTKFEVRNNRGGLLGGYDNRKDAEMSAEKFTKKYKKDPSEYGYIYAFVVENK